VRTVTQGEHEVRIAFPPGRREKGSGHVVEILHPTHENPGYCPSKTRMQNPAELVLMGANPSRGDFFDESPEQTKKRLAKEGKKWTPKAVWKHYESLRRKELRERKAADDRSKNPTRSQRIRGARERSAEIRHVREEFRSERNPSQRWAIQWHTGNISQAFHSRGEAERMLGAFHDAGKIIRVNPMPAESERYRNPIGAEAAEAQEIREGFVHQESRGYRVADEPLIPSGDYAELGTGGMVRGDGESAEAYLAVRPAKGGYRLQIGIPKGVTFLSDTTRRKIWIAGAVEISPMELAMFTDEHAGRVTLGEAMGIGYIAVKYHPQIENHAAGRRILWEHEFGEETGVRPTLIYHAEQQRLSLEGGAYTVKDEGIVN
jgi:hypothetical protein